MGPLVETSQLWKSLNKAGNDLLKPHPTADSLLTLLDKTESLLAAVEQDPNGSVKDALFPVMKALVSTNLLKNADSDVKVFVVSCLTEIIRITAPEAPYDDDEMKDIFQVTIEGFGKLADMSCRSYKKVEAVLDTVSKVKSSLIMLDLECDDLILEMFRQFLKIIRSDHPQPVILAMETIMITVLEEAEDIPMDLLETLLNTVKKKSKDVSLMASKLVEKVLNTCASKLKPYITEALKSNGTKLNMYYPIVVSICQNKAAITDAQIIVTPKEIEADEKKSEEQVVPMQEKMSSGIPRKGNRSKRTPRAGTRQAKGDEKLGNGNDSKQLLKNSHSESTDDETESECTRRRGKKSNSSMNPKEGYSVKSSSSKKVQAKELGEKSAAKKTPLPSKAGHMNESVVISRSPSQTGSRKRSRSKTEGRELVLATPASKKRTIKKGNPEEDLMEANFETPKDNTETAKSNKKQRAQNSLAKTSPKKPLAESKRVTTGRKPDSSDAKKKNSEDIDMDLPIPQPSKSKKKNSPATMPLTKESEQTPRSNLKRKRTAEDEVESNKSEFGDELVGKRVKVWWPLDKKFYEGVVSSYSHRKKTHKVGYNDGDAEELNMKKERWEIIEDNDSDSEDEEIDQSESESESESGTLFDYVKTLKAKKGKNVERSSSPESSSSIQTMMKKDTATKSTKQAKRTKGGMLKGVNFKAETREETSAAPGRTNRRTSKRQKVSPPTFQESEEDYGVKEEPERKVEVGLKSEKESKAELECNGDRQEPLEDLKAETKTDGEELKSVNKANAEPETTTTDGEEQEVAKVPIAEPKTGAGELKSASKPNTEPGTAGEEQEVTRVPIAEPKTDREDDKVAEESAAEPKTDGVELQLVKEPNEVPKTDRVELKSNAEQEPTDGEENEVVDGEEKEVVDVPIAETKADGEERKVVDELTAEPKTDGEDHKVVEGLTANPNTEVKDLETKTDGEENKAAKESTAEPKSGEEYKVAIESTADPDTEVQELQSVKEPNDEPKVQERESAKEATAETKSIVLEYVSEEKETNGETDTGLPETGKVENETEEEVIKELKEESDKTEVGTCPGPC